MLRRAVQSSLRQALVYYLPSVNAGRVRGCQLCGWICARDGGISSGTWALLNDRRAVKGRGAPRNQRRVVGRLCAKKAAGLPVPTVESCLCLLMLTQCQAGQMRRRNDGALNVERFAGRSVSNVPKHPMGFCGRRAPKRPTGCADGQ